MVLLSLFLIILLELFGFFFFNLSIFIIICFCRSSIIEKVCLCWSVLTLYLMCEPLIIALGTNYFLAERKCFFHFLRECDMYTHCGHTPTLECTHRQPCPNTGLFMYSIYTHWNCDFKETSEREKKFLVFFFFYFSPQCCPITVLLVVLQSWFGWENIL